MRCVTGTHWLEILATRSRGVPWLSGSSQTGPSPAPYDVLNWDEKGTFYEWHLNFCNSNQGNG